MRGKTDAALSEYDIGSEAAFIGDLFNQIWIILGLGQSAEE